MILLAVRIQHDRPSRRQAFVDYLLLGVLKRQRIRKKLERDRKRAASGAPNESRPRVPATLRPSIQPA